MDGIDGFRRRRFSWSVAATSVGCCAVVLSLACVHGVRAGDGEELNAELIFTYGEGGQRRGDQFCIGETVYCAMRIAGLKGDGRKRGRYSLEISVLDSAGKEVSAQKAERRAYFDLSGSGVWHLELLIAPPHDMRLEGDHTIQVKFTHLETGGIVTASRRMSWNVPHELTGMQYRITLDEQGQVPAGPTLRPGIDYFLHFALVKFQLKDYEADIEVSVKIVDQNGRSVSGTVLTGNSSVGYSRFSAPPKSLNVNIPFTVNQSGKFVLHCSATDRNGQQGFEEDVPVRVVSSFDD